MCGCVEPDILSSERELCHKSRNIYTYTQEEQEDLESFATKTTTLCANIKRMKFFIPELEFLSLLLLCVRNFPHAFQLCNSLEFPSAKMYSFSSSSSVIYLIQSKSKSFALQPKQVEKVFTSKRLVLAAFYDTWVKFQLEVEKGKKKSSR